MALEFEWDATKAAENLSNHGVSFGEAEGVFADPFGSRDARFGPLRRRRSLDHAGSLLSATLGRGSLYGTWKDDPNHQRSAGDPLGTEGL
jgi:hypothetical protein